MGDLGYMHTRTYRCCLKKDERLHRKRLVLTRIDCLDMPSYNKKVEEADIFTRFSHHPNVATLHSYWGSIPNDPTYYKTIYMLFEEATVGDLNRCLVNNPLKPSKITVTKYICDLSKGLGMLHQSGVCHGGIRPTNLYINQGNHLELGPIKKSETDYMR